MTHAKIGHNNGPTMEQGFAFRKHAWAKARADLLPSLPIEILRGRVKRAQALGLPYKTYASVRASTGRDIVGFLFSNNALRMLRPAQLSPRVPLLEHVNADLAALIHAPLSAAQVQDTLAAQGLTVTTAPAPHFADRWSDIAAAVQTPLRDRRLPFDGVMVIGDTAHERDWCAAGRLAGFMTSESYFCAANAAPR